MISKESRAIAKIIYKSCKNKKNISKKALIYRVQDFIDVHDSTGPYSHSGIGKLQTHYVSGKNIAEPLHTTAFKVVKILNTINCEIDISLDIFEKKLTELLNDVRINANKIA